MMTLFLIAEWAVIIGFIFVCLVLIGTEICNEIRIKKIIRKAQEK
jgi:hypothetical protein